MRTYEISETTGVIIDEVKGSIEIQQDDPNNEGYKSIFLTIDDVLALADELKEIQKYQTTKIND